MDAMREINRLRDIDRSFLDRYDLVGPRYTSYPTAPEWSDEVGSEALVRHLTASKEAKGKRPLSIYVHIPFCITHCTFCACNTIISSRMEEVSEPYLDLLEREMALYSQATGENWPVIQHHWVGEPRPIWSLRNSDVCTGWWPVILELVPKPNSRWKST